MMALAQVIPAGSVLPWYQAVQPVLTEAEAAAWQVLLGRRVVLHRERYWLRVVRGFYQPVHLLAPLRAEEATRPARDCWGFRARLASAAIDAANGSLPVHLLPDPRGYEPALLSPGRRQKIRRTLRELELVALTSPDLLLDQGYGIACEAKALSPGVELPEPIFFRRWVLSHFAPARGLILAGLRHGRLLGYCSTILVDGIAYQDRLFVGAEGRRYNLTLCLLHLSSTLVARCPQVRELMNGLHLRENAGVCAFKRGLGLNLVQLPARTWLAPLAEPLLRRARPHASYRLTGRG